MAEKAVHLIYIHGFQGNDTTFQSFPSDLQEFLTTHVTPRVNIKFNSTIYPTYKSVKPLSYASRNFLQWLATQPPGPCVLLGHSMGGLLAAEAATDPSNYEGGDQYPGAKPNRIVGMVAFDTPYLGMHPHVVISGIASLFAKEEETKSDKTEEELNPNSQVNFVDQQVTDDWDAFKRGIDGGEREKSSSLSVKSPSPAPRSPSPASAYGLPPSPMIDKALVFVQNHQNDPLVRWARKHADDPFSSGKRWIVEHFQFGSCMFDPSGLKERYARLVAWPGGMWVNYWTQTGPKPKTLLNNHSERSISPQSSTEGNLENDLALLENGMADTLSINTATTSSSSFASASDSLSSPGDSVFGPKTKSEVRSDEKTAAKTQKAEEKARHKEQRDRLKQLKQLQKQREKADKQNSKPPKGNHFIVLPTGLASILGGKENWEKVPIGGVDDEVAAHCGLFIRGQNLDYDGLVARVAQRVTDWCTDLK